MLAFHRDRQCTFPGVQLFVWPSMNTTQRGTVMLAMTCKGWGSKGANWVAGGFGHRALAALCLSVEDGWWNW